MHNSTHEQVVPMFSNLNGNGIPPEWLKRIRRRVAMLVPQFTADRMVKAPRPYSMRLLKAPYGGLRDKTAWSSLA